MTNNQMKKRKNHLRKGLVTLKRKKRVCKHHNSWSSIILAILISKPATKGFFTFTKRLSKSFEYLNSVTKKKLKMVTFGNL